MYKIIFIVCLCLVPFSLLYVDPLGISAVVLIVIALASLAVGGAENGFHFLRGADAPEDTGKSFRINRVVNMLFVVFLGLFIAWIIYTTMNP